MTDRRGRFTVMMTISSSNDCVPKCWVLSLIL